MLGGFCHTANHTVFDDIQYQLFSAIRGFFRRYPLSFASTLAEFQHRPCIQTHAYLCRYTGRSLDSHHSDGLERGAYDCSMRSMSRISHTNQPTPKDRRGDSVCREDRVYPFLYLGLTNDTQDDERLGWMYDPDLSHYDHRGEDLPRSGVNLLTPSQAYDSAC